VQRAIKLKPKIKNMDFKTLKSNSLNGGIQYHFKADNGYGASIVQHPFSYGSNLGLWELAVIGKDGRICYDTPITSDVLGHLTEEDVNSTLEQIAALPSE
jgi:hypothetical protein